MQIPATTKYIRADLEALRPGELVAAGRLQPINAPGMLSPGRRVVPFSVRPAAARAAALEWVRSQELAAAEDFYRRTFNAQEIRGVDLELMVTHQATFPIYVPAYVFSRELPPSLLEQLAAVGLAGRAASSTKLHTFVSGVAPGVVSGSQVYDPAKVGLATAAAGPALLWAMGAGVVLTGPAMLILGAILGGLGGATIARHTPQLRKAAADAQAKAPQTFSNLLPSGIRNLLGWGQAAEEEPQADGRTAGGRTASERMEDAWVRAYEKEGDRYRRTSSQQHRARQGPRSSQQQQQQQQQQYRQQQGYQQQQQYQRPDEQTFGTRGDPKGYYRLLGVSKGAAASEVQEAFRVRALQVHPDKFQKPEDKKSATEAFQKLTEAYSVLRSPSKRAAYDAGALR